MGTWLSIGHPRVAEVSATDETDFVLIDTEHTTIGLETVENMSRAIESASSSTDTLVRVPWNDPVRIKRVLDIGVDGIMVPMIDTVAEARDFVTAMRYPPDGIRGIASGRAADEGESFEEYVKNANGNHVTIVQIETEQAVENAPSIATVDGVDALFVGPADLSAAIGRFGQWGSDEFNEILERVVNAAHEAGIPIGTLTVNAEHVDLRIQQGFDFLIVGKDTASLTNAISAARAEYDSVLSERATQSQAASKFES
ncbi:HpcH/HpaI aldolase family protein [Haladaptatus caseinilyticus]|uniref:HpcH/HpaI aldolase family protein n=1 Tax=Haladaptatus caseinilyticus TaxID=2993314 RepID=UPI00224A60B4|nr:aldolase/citrate lyase family protein [Haladaptatus caseinilyticus]